MNQTSLDNEITVSEIQQLAFKLFNDDDTVEAVFGGSGGGGKRLAVGTPVLTLDGWKKVEDVTYQDQLIDRYGQPTNILNISKTENKPTYRLTLQDGRTIDADAEHQWLVASGKHFSRDGYKVKTTEELLNSKDTFSLPYLERPVVGKKWRGVDPYVVGLILGDGCLTGANVRVYSIDQEIISYLENIGWATYDYDSISTIICEATNNRLKQGFIDLLGKNSGDNKYIPEELLLADPTSRLSLLQGLMDTDGTIEESGKAQFITTNENLRDGVMYLARSLGGRASYGKKYKQTDRGGRGWYYCVYIGYGDKFNPFRLPRKANRVKKQQLHRVGIKSIKYIGKTDGVCFMVDNPEHLYIAKDFIVTHNSVLMGMLALSRCLDCPGVREGIGRKDLSQLKKTTLTTLLGKVHAIFGITQADFHQGQDGAITYRNGSKIIPVELDYYPSDPDFNRLGSLEITDMFIDEVGELTEQAYNAIRSRVGRWKNDEYGITPKLFSSCNPSQNFIRQYFYDKYEALGGGDVQRWHDGYTVKNGQTIPAYSAFIRSSVYDNPFIERSYIESLKRLPTRERKRLLDGNWNYADDESSLFKMSLLERALVYSTPEKSDRFEKYIGVDLSDKGGDRTIFSLIDNGVLVAQKRSNVQMNWDEASEAPMSVLISNELIEFAQRNGFTPQVAKHIAVETNGIGVGCRDILKDRGWYITEYVATHRSRSQNYYQLMLDLDAGLIKILEGLQGRAELFKQLSAHTYDMNNQEPSVLKKDKLKQVLGRSPDEADSFMIANFVRNWVSNPQNDPRRNRNRIL